MNASGRSPRVLVVEDGEEIAGVLQRSLRMEGYDVRISGDGEAALADARSFVPDLLVLDLGLPRTTGWGWPSGCGPTTTCRSSCSPRATPSRHASRGST